MPKYLTIVWPQMSFPVVTMIACLGGAGDVCAGEGVSAREGEPIRTWGMKSTVSMLQCGHDTVAPTSASSNSKCESQLLQGHIIALWDCAPAWAGGKNTFLVT